MNSLSLRFIRWGNGLLTLGLLTGYGPLQHYLSGGVTMACPWAPIHGHTVLLGWVSFTLFGLVYRAIPDWGIASARAVRIATIHLWISIVSVLGVYANGVFGYRILNHFSAGFFYKPDMPILRLWLSIDGAFLSIFGIGCLLFMIVLFGSTNVPQEA